MTQTNRLWIVLGTDYPDNLEKRMAARAAHFAYWESQKDADGKAIMQMGGPVTDEAGERMIGSMFLLRLPTLAQAQALLAEDPYVTQGVFETYEIRPWKWLVGTPETI
ncbi:YciL protein [Candidatus Phaeomarinobacter ectocarpi]|uniref:YciL protein n=1 Tax=Candidatus Phaeomarinibacter ectocarpi TaxID=1458461 RepID=X5M8J5_9HYPH|nr:YciI family protein [Candidatus Phaeomarinobacter ectocarpi]CDO59643.1 YciL protein [Candidatus Phaeomarinobacter ectocarpi]